MLTLTLFISTSSLAWGTLTQQSVEGLNRYCHYSDGGVLTRDSVELCPIDNANQSHRTGRVMIQVDHRRSGMGALKDQKVKGFDRYCYYTNDSIVTVDSSELCPLTDNSD